MDTDSRKCKKCLKPLAGQNSEYCSMRCYADARRLDAPPRLCRYCKTPLERDRAVESSKDFRARTTCGKDCRTCAKRVERLQRGLVARARTADVRVCIACQTPLEQRCGETDQNYARRRTCSLACRAVAIRQGQKPAMLRKIYGRAPDASTCTCGSETHGTGCLWFEHPIGAQRRLRGEEVTVVGYLTNRSVRVRYWDTRHDCERVMEVPRGRLEGGPALVSAPRPPSPRAGTGLRLAHDGQTYTLAEWARVLGVSLSTLKGRLRRGWSLERALVRANT